MQEAAIEAIGRVGALQGFGGRAHEIAELAELMTASWRGRPAGRATGSVVGFDSTPIEFPVVLAGGAQAFRFNVEVLGDPPSAPLNWQAAEALNRQLEARYGVGLGRAVELAPLVRPEGGRARFAALHGAVLPRVGPPSFRYYVNLYAAAAKGRPWVEAFEALGLGGAARRAAAVLRPSDRPGILAIEFGAEGEREGEPRAKLYVEHRADDGGPVRPDDLGHAERVAALAEGRPAGAALESVEALVPGWREGRSTVALFASTTLHFRGDGVGAATTNLTCDHRAAARGEGSALSDGAFAEGVGRLLRRHEGDEGAYRRLLGAFAPEPLEREYAAHNFVGIKHEAGRASVTVYFNPRLAAGARVGESER